MAPKAQSARHHLHQTFSRTFLQICHQDVHVFYARYWEACPLLIRGRRRPDYYTGWLSTEEIQTVIASQSLRYGTDLDVTNVVNGARVTLNPLEVPKLQDGTSIATSTSSETSVGQAVGAAVDPAFVWRAFGDGCSLRLPCPQKYW